MDTFNIVVGIIGMLGFGLAIWQYVDSRNQRRSEQERLAVQASRNHSAIRAAIVGAQITDMIVQRAKENAVTTAELQNLARAARGTLLTLAFDLEEESKVLDAWRVGKQLTYSEAPSVREELHDLVKNEPTAAKEPEREAG